MKKFRFLSVLLLLLSGCSRGAQPSSTQTKPPDTKALRRSIEKGAQYLAHATRESGEFVYLDHLDPSVTPGKTYNEVRHAGALYPLGEYYARYEGDKKIRESVKAAAVRAAKFFTKKYVAPLTNMDGNVMPRIIGSWSVPSDEGVIGNPQVKLGGVGLGLVGLLEIEKIAPGTTPLETLRGLGRCLVFLQEKDGRFYSKYDPRGDGKLDQWDSLYYPGEAALGLAMLYEFDPDPKLKVLWLNTAFKAIGFLANARRNLSTHDLPIDHWLLIATARLWPSYAASDGSIRRDLLLESSVNLCHAILQDSALHGARTTPTATRLEGLLAALSFLPPEQADLKKEIIAAVTPEIHRLMEVQVQSGDLTGAIPRDFSARQPAAGESTPANKASLAGEIRIDYVQHAISAMMTYDQMVLNYQPSGNSPSGKAVK